MDISCTPSLVLALSLASQAPQVRERKQPSSLIPFPHGVISSSLEAEEEAKEDDEAEVVEEEEKDGEEERRG